MFFYLFITFLFVANINSPEVETIGVLSILQSSDRGSERGSERGSGRGRSGPYPGDVGKGRSKGPRSTDRPCSDGGRSDRGSQGLLPAIAIAAIRQAQTARSLWLFIRLFATGRPVQGPWAWHVSLR